MQARVRARLEGQFDLFESQGACFAPESSGDKRALARASMDVSGESPYLWRRLGRGVSEFVSPFPGLYLRGDFWLRMKDGEAMLHVLRALATAHPTWVFCSYSAALLHGLDLPWPLLDCVHVGLGKGSWTRGNALISYHELSVSAVERATGVRTVSLCEAVLESLCAAPFEFGLAIADSALHQRRATRERLEAYFDTFGKRRRGIIQARATLSYADARAENGGESRARAVMIEEGYAPHDLQVPFPDPLCPSHVMRGDMGWVREDGSMCIGELDGMDKYEDPAMSGEVGALGAMRAERFRESRISAYGVDIMRFPFSAVENRFELVRLMQLYQIPRSEIPLIP